MALRATCQPPRCPASQGGAPPRTHDALPTSRAGLRVVLRGEEESRLTLALAFILGRYELIKIPPDVYFVDHLPVSLQLDDVGKIVVASIVVAFLATIYPAIQASRLEPVDAIRHD